MSYILFVSIVRLIFNLNFDFRNLTLAISYEKRTLSVQTGDISDSPKNPATVHLFNSRVLNINQCYSVTNYSTHKLRIKNIYFLYLFYLLQVAKFKRCIISP